MDKYPVEVFPKASAYIIADPFLKRIYGIYLNLMKSKPNDDANIKLVGLGNTRVSVPGLNWYYDWGEPAVSYR